MNSNIEAATKAGALLAERAKAAGVEEVVFDRGGFRYHGRVAALADAAREETEVLMAFDGRNERDNPRDGGEGLRESASSTSTEWPRSSRAVVVSRSPRSW